MRKNNEPTLDSILAKIDMADDFQTDTMLQKLIQHYHQIHPETELITLSIPRNDPEERKNIYRWLLNYLETYESIQIP